MRRLETTPQGAQVMLGQSVEITREESRQLQSLSEQMQRLAKKQSKGWFLPWLQAHQAAHQVLRRIFERSHSQ